MGSTPGQAGRGQPRRRNERHITADNKLMTRSVLSIAALCMVFNDIMNFGRLFVLLTDYVQIGGIPFMSPTR